MTKCDACGGTFEGEATWTNTCKLCPACVAAVKYRYYYLSRPPGYAHQPDGFSNREVWMPMQAIPGTQRMAFGWVEYVKPLDFERVWKWDLLPDEADELHDYWDWREDNNR